MSVEVSAIYSRKTRIAGQPGEICNTNIEMLLMADKGQGAWTEKGKLDSLVYGKREKVHLPDQYTTIKKQWAVLINNQVFRICSNQSEAEAVRSKVIKTIEQVKDLEDEQEISYANLFNLNLFQSKVEQNVKRVNLD